MNMVEKMARTAFDSLHGDTHTGGWDFGTGDVNISEEHKERFRKIARAVLTALSEPTEDMVEAAERLNEIYDVHLEVAFPIEEYWQAMLAAASKD